ncbi:MAG: rRNA methyltransferase, partial [Yaniella sp.]|nr:rRNA methyltransferase [Yaniella sp.]
MTTEYREPGWEEREVGVGPWEGDWPEGDHWDQTLLAEGDRRNVADHYRYWTVEAIV